MAYICLFPQRCINQALTTLEWSSLHMLQITCLFIKWLNCLKTFAYQDVFGFVPAWCVLNPAVILLFCFSLLSLPEDFLSSVFFVLCFFYLLQLPTNLATVPQFVYSPAALHTTHKSVGSEPVLCLNKTKAYSSKTPQSKGSHIKHVDRQKR